MTEEEISKWAKKLIHRFDNVKIVGAGGEWSGDARQGFMFNPRPNPIVPTPSVTGACCFDDGSCSVTTAEQCFIAGGVYQGDGTTCVPNPCGEPSGACCKDGDCTITTEEGCDGEYQGDGTTCDDVDCGEVTTGACCVGTDCTIETPSNCDGIGGIYQGDGTVCDPNPCGCVDPSCAFNNPLGDGRCFLTAFYTQDVRIYGGGGGDHACCRELGGTETWTDCVLSVCSDRTEFSFDCSTYFDHGIGCTNSCIGVYDGCSYLPGQSIAGETVTYTYCCDDGCTEGVDCVECGTVTVTYSDEVVCCP